MLCSVLSSPFWSRTTELVRLPASLFCIAIITRCMCGHICADTGRGGGGHRQVGASDRTCDRFPVAGVSRWPLIHGFQQKCRQE